MARRHAARRRRQRLRRQLARAYAHRRLSARPAPPTVVATLGRGRLKATGVPVELNWALVVWSQVQRGHAVPGHRKAGDPVATWTFHATRELAETAAGNLRFHNGKPPDYCIVDRAKRAEHRSVDDIVAGIRLHADGREDELRRTARTKPHPWRGGDDMMCAKTVARSWRVKTAGAGVLAAVAADLTMA